MRKQSNWLKNFFKSQLLLSLALLVILAFLIVPLLSNLNKRSQLDKEISQLKAEVARNEAQNNDFKKMIEYLDSDQFAEEQAKLNLNLKKEGEKVVSIKDLPATESSVDSAVEATPLIAEPAPTFSVGSRINLWLDYFFGQQS